MSGAGAGGTLIFINRLNRMFAAIKFWALPILVGTKILYVISLIYEIFYTGKNGYGADYIKYYCHKFILFLNEKYPDSGASLLGWLDGYIRPEIFITAFSDGDPEAKAEAFWFISTTHHIIVASEICTGAILVLAVVAWYVSRIIYERQTADKFIRGSVLTTPKALNQMLRRDLGSGTIKIGGGFLNTILRRNIYLPTVLECQSAIFLGKSGQGKTVLLNSLLSTVLKQNHKCCILSLKDGDFISTHADLTRDQVYCPGDSRSVGWSFMVSDIVDLSDFDTIGYVFFPENLNATGPWLNGAREIFVGLLKYAYVSGQRLNKQIYYDIFCHKDGATAWREMLLKTPDGTKAAGMLALPDSPTAFGFFITVLCGIKPLQILAKNDGDFSIRKWMQDETAGSVFLISKERFKKMLAPAQSLFLEMLMINHLDMKQDLNRRLIYLLDELPNLLKINRLDGLLAIARSVGSSVYISSQSYVQLDSVYSEPVRRSMCNNCNLKVLFCIADPKTAEESSAVIGKAEYELSRETMSTSASENRDSISNMKELKEKTIVMPSELSNLKMKELYVSLPAYGTAKTKIKYRKYPKINEAFCPDPNYDIATIQAEYDELQKKVDKYYASIAVEDAKIVKENVLEQEPPTNKQEQKDDLRYQQTLVLVNEDDDGGLGGLSQF